MVAWGDDHYVPYTEFNPSGTEVTFSHAWSNGGDYTVVAKAKDKFGAKSPQAFLNLKITKSRAVTNPILFQLLEKLMEHFPILARFFW
jgi:ABC-type glycerol-3-phosphate transport system substrate-binding protein